MDNIFKKKTFWLVFGITILGSWLRLIFINKPEGLWNDEYLSWMIAAIPYSKTFWHEILSQCHMPFYYLFLKFFIHFLGSGDLMLRITSAITGVLTIPAMYFIGKEFKDEKLGVLCAAVTSLSSFLIYFSQEVRFYEILFLFAAFSLLFTLKIIKSQKIWDIIWFIFFNFMVIFTHTIGFVYVFFNLIFVSFCLLKYEKFKKAITISWGLIFLAGLSIYPLIHMIISDHWLSQWWGHFSISNFGFLITDYFSPILTNIVSAPENFFYNFTFMFLIFSIIPSLIALSGIVKALSTKKREVLGLFFIALAFILVLAVMAISGKMLFITKYSIEIYPILILVMSFGLLEYKKELRQILIFLFIFLNLFYLIASSHSAPKLHRSEGHKIVADLIKNAKLQNGDFVVLTYYPKERFEKYFNFDNYNVISVNKGNFEQYSDKNFDKKFKEEILSKIKPGQKVALVILQDVAMYSPMQLKALRENQKEYKKIPSLFITFSKIRNYLFNACLKNLQILRIEEKGSWMVITFVKR